MSTSCSLGNDRRQDNGEEEKGGLVKCLREVMRSVKIGQENE